MKKYKVDSLSKYLALIEENIISDFIYRGQSEPYFSIQASGFRPYCGGWDSDMIYDMPYLHTSFYNRVIGQLSEDERNIFGILSTSWDSNQFSRCQLFSIGCAFLCL